MACYCCVKGCRNNNHKQTDKHFFRFPKNDKKRQSLWRKFARKNVNSTSVICCDHFAPHLLIKKNKKFKLKNEAVPTIYECNGERITVGFDGDEYCGPEAEALSKTSQCIREEEIVMKVDGLKSRCRFCSESTDELIEMSNFANYNIQIESFLQSLGFLMIESDLFPNSVCEECFNQVISLDSFVVKCKSSDQRFWDEIGKLKNFTTTTNTSVDSTELTEATEPENLILVDEEEQIACDNILDIDRNPKAPTISYEQQEIASKEIEEKQKPKRRKICEIAAINSSCNKFALRTYNCDLCQQVFAGQKTFKSHICDLPEIKCGECGDRFDSAFALKSHKKYLHEGNNSKNFCPICKTVITGKLSVFKKHKVKCSQGKIESIQCQLCDKVFTTLHAYTVHEMFHDSKTKLEKDVLATKPKRKAEIICELCGKTYTTVGDCRRHIKLKHTEITEVFNCDICNKNYPSKSVLKDHFRNTHVYNEVVCTFCGKVFRNKTHLKKHMVYHDESKKVHRCLICPEQPGFFNLAGLRRHDARHSNHDDKVNYNCDICVDVFHTNFQLISHMKHVHGTDQ